MKNTLRQKGLYISILNQGEIRADLSKIINEITQSEGYRVSLEYPFDKPITNNRNKIVQRFLDKKDCDYLMMIDSDIVPPKNILNLVDFQKDIITPLMFVIQKKRIIPLALRRARDGIYGANYWLEKTGLTEVDATGTGCIILSRKVLEAIKFPFRNEYDADGVKIWGLDINFCQRAKKLGFKSYVHLDYIASHFMEYDIKKLYYQTAQQQRLEEEIKLTKEYLKRYSEKVFNRIKIQVFEEIDRRRNNREKAFEYELDINP